MLVLSDHLYQNTFRLLLKMANVSTHIVMYMYTCMYCTILYVYCPPVEMYIVGETNSVLANNRKNITDTQTPNTRTNGLCMYNNYVYNNIHFYRYYGYIHVCSVLFMNHCICILLCTFTYVWYHIHTYSTCTYIFTVYLY